MFPLINVWVRQRKRVANKFDSRFAVVGDDDFDDIETKQNVGIIQQPQPGESASRDALLLLASDGVQWPSEIFPGARFHFHENECVIVAANEVDFAPAATTKIPKEDFVAGTAQEFRGQLLAARAALEMLRTRTRKAAAPPARKIGDGSDKARAHAIW